MADSVVCTLFEGHYHFGVAGLVNSLYKQGFTGKICIGYKGELPPWAKIVEVVPIHTWHHLMVMKPIQGIEMCFFPISTTNHLTNYKPDFLLDIWNYFAPEAEHLFYFDPDIIITKPWSWFQYWANCGVALCEDINSPVPENHPKRNIWRQYFHKAGIHLNFKQEAYFNGGFIGLNRNDKNYLALWKLIQDEMGKTIGGLGLSIFNTQGDTPLKSGPFSAFSNSDQDALNACVEAWNEPVSYIGREAMGFRFGDLMMAHALGAPKPWNKNYLVSVFKGIKPNSADRLFWSHMMVLIRPYKPHRYLLKSVFINIAAFLGRFYGRAI